MLKLILAALCAWLCLWQISMDNRMVALYWAVVMVYWLVNYFDGKGVL